jgi:hypothetical protein
MKLISEKLSHISTSFFHKLDILITGVPEFTSCPLSTKISVTTPEIGLEINNLLYSFAAKELVFFDKAIELLNCFRVIFLVFIAFCRFNLDVFNNVSKEFIEFLLAKTVLSKVIWAFSQEIFKF